MTPAPGLPEAPDAPPAHRLPVVLRGLLRVALDDATREIVLGDLEEEFRDTRARRGAGAAHRLAWRLALGSIVACWRDLGRPPSVPHGRRDGAWMHAWLQDFRFGLRQLRRDPATTLAAVVTLALGIAATATILGLVNALVLRPLAYADPARVAFVLGRDVATGDLLFNLRYQDAADIAGAGIFEDVAVYRGFDGNLTGGGLPERVQAYHVTPNTFELLGVAAARGRTFGPADLEAGNDRLVVLSHGTWLRRYGGDPSAVGRLIEVNGEAHTVVGVMPAPFEFPVFNFKGDLWIPLRVTPDWTPADRAASPSVVVIARLATGTSLAGAQDATDAVMAGLAQSSPATNARRGATVVPMAELGREQTLPVFALLGVAGALLLVVACVNVAGLLLARGTARDHELSVRAAMGAGRLRLIRQLLAESLLMAIAAGVLGAGLAWWALEMLRRAMPAFIVRVLPGVEAVGADPASLGVAMAVALGTVVLFGLLPAWQSSAARAADVLRGGARTTAATRRRWLRQALVVAEVAISVALLVTTVLLGRSVGHLSDADPGFAKDEVLALSVSLPAAAYPTDADRLAFFTRATDRLRALPGVQSVGLVHVLPFSTSDASVSFEVPDGPAPEGGRPTAAFRIVTPEYFDAMGIPVRAGRAFQPGDGDGRRHVAIVNQRFAERYFGSEPAVGRQLRLEGVDPAQPMFEVVGVVSDVHHSSLAGAAAPELYLPYAIEPRATMTLAVRTLGDPASVAPDVRSALAAVDPAIAPYDMAPLSALVRNSFLPQTIASGLVRVLGAGALVLASVGLYGVLAFAVGQRTREIGVRVALGATRVAVVGMVLRQSLALVGLGLMCGVGLAALGAHAAGALLFGVGPLDPISYAGSALLFVAVSLAAAYVPARRALRVDPATALRDGG
jgi:putative ABC transport system permease protein